MPTRARLLFGSFGFSTSRVTLPRSSTSATPNAEGFATSLSVTEAATLRSASNFITDSRIIVPLGARDRGIRTRSRQQTKRWTGSAHESEPLHDATLATLPSSARDTPPELSSLQARLAWYHDPVPSLPPSDLRARPEQSSARA